MGGFWSKLFGCSTSCGSADNEVAAAIAVAVQIYSAESMGSGSRQRSTIAQRRSDWANKSYGMAQLPQRNRRW